MWLSSKIVPMRTVNCLRHPLHCHRPCRTLPSGFFLDGLVRMPAFRAVALSTSPHFGQTGPRGQSFDSILLKCDGFVVHVIC